MVRFDSWPSMDRIFCNSAFNTFRVCYFESFFFVVLTGIWRLFYNGKQLLFVEISNNVHKRNCIENIRNDMQNNENYLKFFSRKMNILKNVGNEGEINNPHIIVISWNFTKQYLCQKRNIPIVNFTLNVNILWQTKIF